MGQFGLGLGRPAGRAWLRREKLSFAEYYLACLDRYAIRYRFYERQDLTLFDESLHGDARRQAMEAGNRKKDRKYTEYWTLIRGAEVRGRPRADRTCPACGAGVKVGMEGNCAYCGALVTSGDFDWVLGRIEQDDSYTG